MSNVVSSIVATAENHARTNLVKGCKELRSFSSTSLLPNGVVRETVGILLPIMNELTALSLAKRLYETLAIERVANDQG